MRFFLKFLLRNPTMTFPIRRRPRRPRIELTYPAALDDTFGGLVLGAGTGGSDGEHRIRTPQIACP